MSQSEINEFLLSRELDELTEHLKTGDSLLDIIDLRELQHSAVIAWMFDPREGHGQGDAILRDFLADAAIAATRKSSHLIPSSSTAKFFKEWTPSRIKTASLNACFILPEHTEGKDRLDLLLIDPANKFFVVIENKAGAKLTDEQLKKYREPCEKWIKQRKRFAGYTCAFIAMDKSFESDGNQDEGQNNIRESLIPIERKNWTLISYSWLASAAQRATLHIGRGNSAARLIQSYCQQQTDWRSKNDERCEVLAAQLWEKYPTTTKQLASIGKKPGKAWVEAESFDDSITEDLYTYAVQNRDVLRALQQSEGLLSVKLQLIANKISPQLIRTSGTKIDLMLCAAKMHTEGSNKNCKIYLRARRLEKDQHAIRIRLEQGDLTTGPVAEAFRAYFFKISKKVPYDATGHTLTTTIESGVSLSKVSERMLAHLHEIEKTPTPKYEQK